MDTLSEEVVSLIIGCGHDLPTMAVLARTSKRFHRLTLPHLYAHVSLLDHKRSSGVGTRHLRSLTFLMLQRPQLAALVRAFTFRGTYATRFRETSLVGQRRWMSRKNWPQWPQHPQLDDLLRTAVKLQTREDVDENAVDNEAARWFRIVRAGFNETAILALLLPNLVNLRSLDVVPEGNEHKGQSPDVEGYRYFMLDMLVRASTRRVCIRQQPMFANLTDVVLLTQDER